MTETSYQDTAAEQWNTTESVNVEDVSHARRNDYFYQHRPHEYFDRSLVILRLLAMRGTEIATLARGLDEFWVLELANHKIWSDAGDADAQIDPFVVIQGLMLKYQAIETLLRHILAHRESPTEPWSHISQLKVPRHFSERVRQLRELENDQRTRLVEEIFFGVTATNRLSVSPSGHEWSQQLAGIDSFVEMCLRCWLDDQGPFLAVKHGHVAIPYLISPSVVGEEVAEEDVGSELILRYITRNATANVWEFQAASPDEPDTVACEIYFASRLLRQLLDVGRVRNIASEDRTIDVIWWDDALRERVRSGTLDITEGPPPMRQWTVPADAPADA